jgi:hypothetical protein
MANEVKIKLTEEQKAKIKEGTGQELGEIRVSHVGNNPALAATNASGMASARSAAQSIAARPAAKSVAARPAAKSVAARPAAKSVAARPAAKGLTTRSFDA